jgi:hypothetical protein
MENKKFFEKITPLQLVIALCVVAVSAVLIYKMLSAPAVMVADVDVPLSSSDVIKVGDQIAVRISAPAVTDLYGYQFELGYDNTMFTPGNPDSLLDEIPTIFKKDFEDHVLVGATMTGDTPGYTVEEATDLCEVKLTAKVDGAVPEFTISGVNVVSATDMAYTENIEGWTYQAVAAAQ